MRLSFFDLKAHLLCNQKISDGEPCENHPVQKTSLVAEKRIDSQAAPQLHVSGVIAVNRKLGQHRFFQF
ncbi:MAG: hypothetical protein CMN21_20250 [Rubinisphaera sp.]|nr:hypothetical protein [Rubinisphaera sp.]